jgi:hypothetical protein
MLILGSFGQVWYSECTIATFSFYFYAKSLEIAVEMVWALLYYFTLQEFHITHKNIICCTFKTL